MFFSEHGSLSFWIWTFPFCFIAVDYIWSQEGMSISADDMTLKTTFVPLKEYKSFINREQNLCGKVLRYLKIKAYKSWTY